MEYLRKVLKQIGDFIGGLTPGRKIALFATLVVVIAGTVGLFYWAGQKSLRPLMTNLNAEDSANIIRVLRTKKIPFRVEGNNIEVPPENVDELRLELATMGLPESSVVGYEIFDRQALGTTNFVQMVNQTRALEGELMRTISSIKSVKRARVHLAIPKKSAFVEDQKPSSASVVVDLEPGVVLSEKQIYGIGRLVASAVPGMEVSDVVIVDSSGKTLSKNVRDPLVALSASQLDFQRKVEEDLEKRVERILAPVTGEGRVKATVSAEVDFSQIFETETRYDPDSAAVRSSQKNTETMQGVRPGPYGAPGATSNTPGELQNGVANQTRTDTSRVREVVNNAVPQTVRRTQKPTGTVTKLSVAVVVDGKLVTSKSETGEVLSKVEPWSPEKLAEIERIVSSSLALDPKRGDRLEVKNMEFIHTDLNEAERIIEQTHKRTYLMNILVYTVIGLIIVLFFMFVVRPFIKWVTENTIDSVDTFLPQTIEEIERLQKNQNLQGLEEVVPELPEEIDPRKVEGEMIKEKIVTLVDSNPHKAALILKDWIRGEPPKKEESQEKTG